MLYDDGRCRYGYRCGISCRCSDIERYGFGWHRYMRRHGNKRRFRSGMLASLKMYPSFTRSPNIAGDWKYAWWVCKSTRRFKDS